MCSAFINKYIYYIVFTFRTREELILRSWLSDDSVGEITKKGYKALAGNYDFWAGLNFILDLEKC